MPQRLIVDCDPGNGVAFSDVDDGLALALALAHPRLAVEAITIVAGNTSLAMGFSSAQEIVARAKSQTPVLAGASGPLNRDDRIWRAALDGRRDEISWARDFDGSVLITERELPTSREAVDHIIDLVHSNPGEIAIAALGPLTNIALAIQRDPTFAQNVRQIVIMGGAFSHDKMPQELNFGYDPEAAHIVMTSGASILLVPFDVTCTTLLTYSQLDSLLDSDPFQAYIKETTLPWLKFSDTRFGLGGCYLHDPLVVAALIDPTLITWDEVAVDVVLTDPIARGRPIRWDHREIIFNGGTQVLPAISPVRVATAVDSERFGTLLVDSIKNFSA